MEHYKSNFEDTKSDVYEVAEKKYGDHVTYDNHHSAGDPVCGGVCSIPALVGASTEACCSLMQGSGRAAI